MIIGQSVIGLLDANVLYPAPVRDILLDLANAKLFQPKWTKEIQNEWTRNLLINRPDLSKEALLRAVAAMNNAFPDANITRYNSLIEELTLPDPRDRHVLAAAIKGEVSHIVTANLKDFPRKVLGAHNLQAIHPDDFTMELILSEREIALEAFEKMVARLKKPPMRREDVLTSLVTCRLPKTAALLKN